MENTIENMFSSNQLPFGLLNDFIDDIGCSNSGSLV